MGILAKNRDLECFGILLWNKKTSTFLINWNCLHLVFEISLQNCHLPLPTNIAKFTLRLPICQPLTVCQNLCSVPFQSVLFAPLNQMRTTLLGEKIAAFYWKMLIRTAGLPGLPECSRAETLYLAMLGSVGTTQTFECSRAEIRSLILLGSFEWLPLTKETRSLIRTFMLPSWTRTNTVSRGVVPQCGSLRFRTHIVYWKLRRIPVTAPVCLF